MLFPLSECFSSPSLTSQLLLIPQSPAQALLPLALTQVSGFWSLLIPMLLLSSTVTIWFADYLMNL